MNTLLPTDRKEYIAFWEFYNRVEPQFITERYSTEARCLASFKAGIEYAKKIGLDGPHSGSWVPD